MTQVSSLLLCCRCRRPLAYERTASASTGARLGCGASMPLGPAMAAPGLKPMAQRFCQQTHLLP